MARVNKMRQQCGTWFIAQTKVSGFCNYIYFTFIPHVCFFRSIILHCSQLSMAPQTISILNLLPEPDVFIHTSHGTRIPAHAPILASMSPVLENFIDRPRKHRSSERIIQIHGVPCDAVTAFVRFLYSSRSVSAQSIGTIFIRIFGECEMTEVPPAAGVRRKRLTSTGCTSLHCPTCTWCSN